MALADASGEAAASGRSPARKQAGQPEERGPWWAAVAALPTLGAWPWPGVPLPTA